MSDPNRFSGIPDQQLQDIHVISERFERTLQSGAEASIEQWLAAASDEIQDCLFRELLAITLERNQLHDDRGVASVLLRFPDRIDDIKQILREMAINGPEAQIDTIPQLTPGDIQNRDPEHRYWFGCEIARGGMGAIIKGRDMELGRDLAIKILLDAHKDNPQIVQHFIDEARICGQLQHPGIAPVYELGHFADMRPYFTMKLVVGETLSKLIAEKDDCPASRGKLICIFSQICETMAYAHSRGVIHRDLKPANVMVGAFGQVQVMDWGLAKVLSPRIAVVENRDGAGPLATSTTRIWLDPAKPDILIAPGETTQSGTVMGTPAYMAPEQALGEVENLDERADVFGLGAILCEILTGKPPYVTQQGASTIQLARQAQLDECFERLGDCDADHALISLTVQCLQRDSQNRPRNAGVLATGITQYMASVETRLRIAELERTAEAAHADAEAALAETERLRAKSERRRVVAEAQQREHEQRSTRNLRKMLGEILRKGSCQARYRGTAGRETN